MAQGVVFKQSYKSRNIASTPTLNVKHLAYIATRKGAIRNPGCGFGLWGCLSPRAPGQDIDDFRAAKLAVREASKGHTVYRAILSVDGETAQRYKLYDRQTWQELVSRNVGIFAKEMGIDQKDFRWLASMHYAKGHPHVHIMYWDTSDRIHQEGMSKQKFTIFATNVRAAFGREIYREELMPQLAEQRQVGKDLRLELKAMLQEANIGAAMNLNNASDAKLDALGEQFVALSAFVPTKGALKYAYLPDEAKAQFNAFLDEVIKVADFSRLYNRYVALTEEINRMYGNAPADREYYQDKAKETLYKNLGNELLAAMKTYRSELEDEAPTDYAELQAVVRGGLLRMLPVNKRYQDLLRQMPKLRTPMRVLLSDEAFAAEERKLVREMCSDLRIRTMVRGYLKAVTKGLPKEEAAAMGKEVNQKLYQAVNHIVRDQLDADAGYPVQERISLMTNVLLRLFGSASRGAGQMRSQRDLLRHRWGMSKAAQKDQRKKREHESGWTFEP